MITCMKKVPDEISDSGTASGPHSELALSPDSKKVLGVNPSRDEALPVWSLYVLPVCLNFFPQPHNMHVKAKCQDSEFPN